MEKILLPVRLAFLDSRVLARFGSSAAAGAASAAGAAASSSFFFLVFFTFLSSAYKKILNMVDFFKSLKSTSPKILLPSGTMERLKKNHGKKIFPNLFDLKNRVFNI